MDILEDTMTSARGHAGPAGLLLKGTLFDWVYLIPCTWLMVGLSLDGWAHNHVPSLETFFTPWHGVLYSGYLASALFLLTVFVLRLRKSSSWQKSLPTGYGLALLGSAIFAAGGVLDLLWHTLFGIERNVEALLSPTHLLLALGGTLIVGGPFRAAWSRLSANPSKNPGRLFPMMISLAYILATLVFFTQFVNPIAHPVAYVSSVSTEPLGIAGILLQTALFMGAALLAVRRWRLPFGAFTVLYTIPALISGLMSRTSPPELVAIYAILTGLLIDGFYLVLSPAATHIVELRVFAFVVPVIINGIYFLGLALTAGVGWSVHLWGGAILMAGVVGLLLSYVLVAPALPAQSPTDVKEE
ncbi:MAG TPA: hypothetical protein VFN35_14380 [Ktedonobacteraceae bacterium]|nr:hypothetical protein [Ktedonobacteraceae bacterium]